MPGDRPSRSTPGRDEIHRFVDIAPCVPVPVIVLIVPAFSIPDGGAII